MVPDEAEAAGQQETALLAIEDPGSAEPHEAEEERLLLGRDTGRHLVNVEPWLQPLQEDTSLFLFSVFGLAQAPIVRPASPPVLKHPGRECVIILPGL